MKKTIYIADDEQNIREIMHGFLTNAGYEVEQFESGDTLLEQFIKKPSDMVILDIMMEGLDGLTVCSKIRENYNVPIIIVSARDSEMDKIIGINIGGDDYLVKPFSPMELVARVNALFRRMNMEVVEATKTLEFEGMIIDTNARTCFYDDSELKLTPTEFAFMAYMFENSDRAISRDELLKKVWQFDIEVDTHVTDDVLKRLRKKLLKTKVRIVTVWGFGFKLSKE